MNGLRGSGNHLSQQEQEHIIKLFETGVTKTQITNRLGLCYSTVQEIIARHKRERNVACNEIK